MIVLVVAFALQCINDVYFKTAVERFLALTPASIASGFVWQFFTFQFFHFDLWHLIGNLLGLWFFGRFAEEVLGRKRFLIAYFGCGVVGGLLQAVLMVLFPQQFFPFVFGASAGVMGVFAIFCRLEANSEIRWNFILPIRAEVLLWITMAISCFFTVVPSNRGGEISHAAHLGGLLAGIAWVKMRWHDEMIPVPWEGIGAKLKSLFRRRPITRPKPAAAPWAKPEARRQTAAPAEVTPAEFMAREVDPILEKIAAHGIHSLTVREKEILERARSKMTKR